jgi:hypothetical protein
MGIKVMTLGLVSLNENERVKIHGTERQAKVIARHTKSGLDFFLKFDDDPLGALHPVHFDAQLQGFATEENEELELAG